MVCFSGAKFLENHHSTASTTPDPALALPNYLVVDIPWMQRVCFANQGKVKASVVSECLGPYFLQQLVDCGFHLICRAAAHLGTGSESRKHCVYKVYMKT